jgi:hypothetical protein
MCVRSANRQEQASVACWDGLRTECRHFDREGQLLPEVLAGYLPAASAWQLDADQ